MKKKTYEQKLSLQNIELKKKLEFVERKNNLLSENINFDYLDILYRTKLKFGTKDEILIKLR